MLERWELTWLSPGQGRGLRKLLSLSLTRNSEGCSPPTEGKATEVTAPGEKHPSNVGQCGLIFICVQTLNTSPEIWQERREWSLPSVYWTSAEVLLQLSPGACPAETGGRGERGQESELLSLDRRLPAPLTPSSAPAMLLLLLSADIVTQSAHTQHSTLQSHRYNALKSLHSSP